jgi:hypothetical protein
MLRKLSVNEMATLDDFIEKASARSIIDVFKRYLHYLEAVLTKKPKDVGAV